MHLEEQVFVGLLRTADALSRGSDALLKPSGLSATQYNVLRILRGAGAEGLACREVGCRMISRDPDITRLLDRLGGARPDHAHARRPGQAHRKNLHYGGRIENFGGTGCTRAKVSSPPVASPPGKGIAAAIAPAGEGACPGWRAAFLRLIFFALNSCCNDSRLVYELISNNFKEETR